MKTQFILLLSFLQIGFFSIGGGYATIPLIQEQVVDIHKWIDFQEYMDIITISQMTPGPLAVNTSTFVGIKVSGLIGAVIATFGCIISGFIISILLYKFFDRYKNTGGVLNILNGLKSVSVGLILSSCTTILLIALFGTMSLNSNNISFNKSAILIFILMFIILKKFKLNPILIMIFSAILGVILY